MPTKPSAERNARSLRSMPTTRLAAVGIVTLAGVFFDNEDEDSYFEVFRTVFDAAEKDCGHKVPFGHLMTDAESPRVIRAL
jgi:hypothetical protein